MPSPNRNHGTASSTVRADIAARLSASHEQRIQELASRLQASLLDPYERDSAGLAALSAASLAQPQLQHQPLQGVRLSEVFDELIACDEANRMQQLTQETTFKDRELQRLREALAKSQSWCAQKQASAEQALSKAASTSSALQTQLTALQVVHEQQRQQLQSLSSAKAAAEHAAALADSRAASVDAQLSSKTAELEQVQKQYKRLLDEQQGELERLRQQLQQQGSGLAKLQTSSAQKEQGLLQQLQAFNSSLVDVRASHAADKATADQLQKQVELQQRELQDARAGKQQAEASVKQLEGMLADSEAERRTLRAKYINLGGSCLGQQEQVTRCSACFSRRTYAGSLQLSGNAA